MSCIFVKLSAIKFTICMSLPLFIAKKYIGSKQGSKFLSFVSVISIGGIALGTAVLIIALTILDGYQEVVSQKIIDFNSHIKITAFGNRNLPDSETIENEIVQYVGEDFKSISKFVSKLGIIKSKKVSEGINIYGIDPQNDNSDIKKFIISGTYNFSSDENSKIVIGKKLADKLDVKVNDKITLFSLKKDEMPSAVNPPAIEQFYVGGIFESGMAEYDDLNVYIRIDDAKKMFGTQNSISGYNIRLNNLSHIDTLAKSLQKELGYPYYVRTIFQVHQNIFTWLELQKEPIPIVLGLIIVVAIFNIVGTLLMIVLERTSSIGVLKSLGFTRKKIIKIFFYQGIYLGLLGILIGDIIALVLSFLQQQFQIISLPGSIYFLSAVPVSISLDNYLLVSVVGLALTLLAALIPSFIASRLNPLTSIRFN